MQGVLNYVLGATRWFLRKGESAWQLPMTQDEQEQIDEWSLRVATLVDQMTQQLVELSVQPPLNESIKSPQKLEHMAKQFGEMRDSYLALAALIKEGPSCGQPS